MNRRQFVTHSCRLSVASATLSSSLLQLGLARQAAAATLSDYRALVCVLLAGGNDSFNMVVPNDADQYGEYAALRSDLALPQASLLPLNGTAGNGRNYGLHPGMAGVQQLYNSGDLAIVANVGTLIDPVDAAAIAAGAKVPLGLYSHSDQIAQWQTAVPDDRIAEGWGGRLADRMNSVNLANGISMNISLGGSNVFQSGEQSTEYAITAEEDGAIGVNAYDDGTEFGTFKKSIIDGLLAAPQTNLLRQEYGNRLRNAIDARAVFVDALQKAPTLTSPFSPSPFSQSLRQIARVISARTDLGACRQTFFVLVGGWDHHDEVLDNQAAMLPAISQGLTEFHAALVELGMLDAVTTFTTSDFGRTLTSNGKGSDHGWGGHHLVMGGAVNGATMFGDYPELSANSPLDTGRGVFVPTTAVDEYFADLAIWLGVSDADLDQVLPNVRRFYTPGSAQPPLGLFA
ncbi:MAG: DUF1501 domain-containing protein [Pseudomonadales bacterium]